MFKIVESKIKTQGQLFYFINSNENAKGLLKLKDIYEVMKGDKKQSFSIELKKIIILLLGLLFPVLMVCSFAIELAGGSFIITNSIVIIAELLIIIWMCYQFFKVYPPFLRNYGYKTYCYSIAKLAYISYFAVGLGMTKGNHIINFSLFLNAILVFLYLYNKVEKNMILEEINKTFNQNYKTSKVLTIMLRVSGFLAVIALVGMQFYRMNKSWIMPLTGANEAATSSVLDDMIGIFFGIPLLLLITLIPTFFLFKANLFVRGKVIEKYAEEFRRTTNFTEKEWYGEK
ncbi:hypothetical protein ACIX1Y_002528 [Listeria innocua]|uniref:hypothetical protein n=1 Tax=Listeria innocua TaxID=1642 RepID=UPI001A98757A|nr:hypothetical protein [Listeria innocua]EKM1326993.1 hypothetical protein [Listeria innocua]EKM1461859.1 hypothetical protein [Listeria innocua]MDH4614373.1 hypothetical protein [Listeria innocua]UPH69661.1 hypothetical protein EWI68_06910 [Listeria innocua]HBM3574455.1 hypothetical protein [Listeria innocua]